MSRGPETTFIQSVHRHLPKDVYRMKNHNEFNGGIADCWYDGPAADLWVEYKFVVVPKRDNTLVTVDLSPLQREWLRDRAKNGRTVAVIVGCKDGGVWLDALAWEEEITAAEFRRTLLSRQELAVRITDIVRHK